MFTAVEQRYQDHKQQLQGARLYMTCPQTLKEGTLDDWQPKTAIEDLRDDLCEATGLNCRSIDVYVRHNDTANKHASRDGNCAVVEICYKGDNSDPTVYLNAQPMLF